jgi:hypothetical protein
MKYRLLAAVTAASLAFVAGPALADHTPAGSAISIPEPPAGKGQIVFYRPSGMGMAMGCTVKEGETKISSVGNGKYVVVVAEPGSHDYVVRSEAKDALTLLVEPDETQFVRCHIKMGIMAGRPDIAPSTPEEFAGASAKLKLVDDDDMGEGARRSTELASGH